MILNYRRLNQILSKHAPEDIYREYRKDEPKRSKLLVIVFYFVFPAIGFMALSMGAKEIFDYDLDIVFGIVMVLYLFMAVQKWASGGFDNELYSQEVDDEILEKYSKWIPENLETYFD